MVGEFGPEYPKIDTMFKRDDHGVVLPNEWSTPEFQYLARLPWHWTEKVDGTNIRMHYDGKSVTLGGRTDRADVSAKLLSNMFDILHPTLWADIFPDCDNVTIYGEGYGSGIQKGGQYRPDQTVIIFDVLVDRWWLRPDDVLEVAHKMMLQVVPVVGMFDLTMAWEHVITGGLTSSWPDARIEGLVGHPVVDLFDRRGNRITTKIKVKDWEALQRRPARG